MSQSKIQSKAAAQATLFADRLIGALLIIVVAIMPLIVRMVERSIPPELVNMMGETPHVDVFSYWKGIFISVPAVLMVLYVVSDFVTSGHIRFSKEMLKKILKMVPVILSLVYLFFVIISTLFSPYSFTAWHGTTDREEGLLMWLTYFVVFFAAMFYVRELKYAKVIMYGLIFSSIIMGLIGISQLVGHDFFDTLFAARLVMGRDMFNMALLHNPYEPPMQTRFDIAHGTLFNPNTFGKYTAMVSPILLLAGFTYEGKRWIKGLFLFAGAVMLISVFASGSLGGLIGIVTASAALVITYGASRGFFVKQIILGFCGVVVALALAIAFVSPLNYRVTTLYRRLGEAMRAETYTGYNYFFEGNTLRVTRGGELMYSVRVTSFGGDGWLSVFNSAGQEVPLSERVVHANSSNYIFYVPGYGTLRFDLWPEYFMMHGFSGFEHFFAVYENGTIYGMQLNGNLIDLSEPVPAWGFYGRETWGSSRGFIWSRSFPLMPSRTIIGSGTDTFVNVFPNHDLVGLQRSFHTPHMRVDKAHNLFIQTWIGTGGISAIALFALFGHYLFTTFFSLVKSKGEAVFSFGLRLGLLAGISGFVMSSMATDSTIGSTGVFFVLLGVGYGLNYWVKDCKTQKDLG